MIVFRTFPLVAGRSPSSAERGGRLVLSTWEAADPSDQRVGPRIHAVILERDLPLAGFVEVQVQEKPDRRAVERAATIPVTGVCGSCALLTVELILNGEEPARDRAGGRRGGRCRQAAGEAEHP